MRHNGRTPLRLSEIHSDCAQFDDDKVLTVKCVDCETWRVVRRGMVVAHRPEPRSSKPAGRRQGPQDRVARCEGSGQRIIVDRKHRDAMPAESRRAARQFYKPLPGPAAPVHRTPQSAPNAEAARTAFRSHLRRCAACAGDVVGRDGERLACPDGERLASDYLRLLRQEPQRRAVREFFARERARFDREYAKAAPAKRRSEWAAVFPAVRAADARRAQRPAGDAPTQGPSVPLTTLRPAR